MVSDVLHIMSDLRSMGVSRALRERGKATWLAAIRHPMVRQIGDGTLPHPTFRRYFEQNVPYLMDYARAIGLIIGKAPDIAAIDVLTRFLGPNRQHRDPREPGIPRPTRRGDGDR